MHELYTGKEVVQTVAMSPCKNWIGMNSYEFFKDYCLRGESRPSAPKAQKGLGK